MPDLNTFSKNANFRVAPNVIGDKPKLKGPSKKSIQENSEDDISTTSVLYDKMKEKWDLIEALWGGTLKMREAGRVWLPQEPKERDEHYENRLKRSVLFNAFKATIDRLISKPFSQSVTVSEITENSIERLNLIKDDVDGTGKNITQFGREVFESGLKYGLTHILVDFTRMPEDIQTLEDENIIQPRPFFVHISPPKLIFWDIQENSITRIPTLKEIRIKEVTVERIGENSNVKVVKIRVFKSNVWQIWRFNEEDDTFLLEKEGFNTLKFIPLVTFYARRTGQLTADPPFEDLAWLNLLHWQSSSDQRNILRFARTGILFGTGFTEGELDGIAWGPNTKVESTNEDAKLVTIEYKGTSIKAGEDDLKTLEERMQLLGLQPLIERTVNSTATAKVLDESKTSNDIQAWVRSLENTLIQAYDLGAIWLSQEKVEDLKLNIFSDFAISMHGTKDLESLIKIRRENYITPETFLREVKHRGILAETVEIEEELAELTRSDDTDNINKNAVSGSNERDAQNM